MRDLRYAIRVLLKSPVFTITATLTLALCIGANTAIYTVVDRVLLRPLPYPQPERLADVVTRFYAGAGSEDDVSQTGGTWVALQRRRTSVELATIAGGFGSMGVNMVAGDAGRVREAAARVGRHSSACSACRPPSAASSPPTRIAPNGPAAAILEPRLWTRAVRRAIPAHRRPLDHAARRAAHRSSA